jgi:hypothetical protein
MVTRPKNSNPYEFVVVSALRAQQLLAGSTPRLLGDHGAPTMAQMEVAGGQVARMPHSHAPEPRQCIWRQL